MYEGIFERGQCPQCGQIELGQEGSIPCPKCGLPTVWIKYPKEYQELVDRLLARTDTHFAIRSPNGLE